MSYSIEHYKKTSKVDNPDLILFSKLFELYQVIQAKTSKVSFHRKFWITFPESNNYQIVEDFIVIGIDTKSLLRLSVQTTKEGKKELETLIKSLGYSWFNIEHHKEELERMACNNWTIAVIRIDKSQEIEPYKINKILDCAYKHLSKIDKKRGNQTSSEQPWYHQH